MLLLDCKVNFYQLVYKMTEEERGKWFVYLNITSKGNI